MGDSKTFRVLVVDDDKDILDLLEYNLRKEGFRVKILEDSTQTIAEAKTFDPHLIILDMMMPHCNGIDICRDLRTIQSFKEIYIFFLTALSDHQQEAYKAGADDYIEKLIGLRALTYKVNTVLRSKYVIRKRILHLKVGGLYLDRETNTVSTSERTFTLSQPEFELLFFLVQNNGKRITHKSLIHNIWGSETYLLDASLDNYIISLKKKLGNHFPQHLA